MPPSYNSSSSVMAPFFANRSCDPFTARDSQCILGTYVQYAVDVASADHVIKALEFAQRKNIRAVIRNTGHDYNGKSTGAGSLGIWMHHLKDIEIIDWTSDRYQGKAMRMGAGVQGFEAYDAAHEQNLAMVGGECPTVGLAGGYTQGGGHSMLGSKYGLGADQVLEWEVIDGKGNHLIATREQNTDLFWALSGGGGGTYGVALSMTVKIYPDLPTSGFNLTFTSDGISQDTYWSLIGAWHQLLPTIVDEGITGLEAFDNKSFTIVDVVGHGISTAKLNSLVSPFLATLNSHNITYNSTTSLSPSYHSHFFNVLQKASIFPVTVSVAQYGGRLIPRSTVENNNSALTSAYRDVVRNGGSLTAVIINVSSTVAGDVYNSVNPAWRTNLLDTVVTTPWNFSAPWEEMVQNANLMTETLIPILQGVSEGSGVYVNEADFQDPDWKRNYCGENYERLLEVKERYDPEHVFYALTGVGSDFWVEKEDGRLCKADP